MRLFPLLVAAPCAALVSLAASTTRADGAFITLKDTAGSVIGKRVAIATFTADTTAPSGGSGAGAGKVSVQPASFEIDGSDDAVAYFGAAMDGRTGSALVEFTTPDAQGTERVTTQATFSLVAIESAAVTLDGTGFGGAYTFQYAAVRYTTAASANVAPLAAPMPVIRRTSARRMPMPAFLAPDPQVNAAYLTLTGAGDSVPKTTVTSAKFSVEAPSLVGASGAGAGKITFNPFTVTLAPPNTVLQNAATTRRNFESGTLSFVHAGADGSATSVLVMNVKLVVVSNDQVAFANGSLSETTTLKYGEVRVSSN